MKNKNIIVLILLLVICIVPSIWYLAMPGFIETDDGGWMVIRFSAFYEALRDGQFPVRFLSRLNYGYGYPVANFLYPGFMYLGIPIKLLGFSFTDTLKIIFASSMILSGVFVFLWLRKLFDDISSFFAGLFYVYAPYHLYDLTRRGSVGELMAFSVLPFVLWQVERQSVVFMAIGIAFLLISHNTLAVLFLGLIILYMGFDVFVSKKRRKLIEIYLASVLFGFGLSAFFWIPALIELPNTVFSKTQVSDFSRHFADYTLVGVLSISVFVLSPALFVYKRHLLAKHRLTLLMLALGIVSAGLAIEASSILWQNAPVSFVQFPFRFLSLTLVAAAFLAAFLISQVENVRYRIVCGLMLMALTLFFSHEYLIARSINMPDTFYSTNEATTTVSDEYMPQWVREKPVSHFIKKAEVVKGEGDIADLSYDTNRLTLNYTASSPSVLRINTIFYPGWTASSNGVSKAVFYDNDYGVMDLKLESGVQKIELMFSETHLRVTSDLVSVMSVIGLAVYVNRKKLSKILKV